jgi:DNA polymerase-3 subunit gamma/tau
MLLKAYDEVRRAPDPAAALEMALVRLAYAADLPGPEEAIRRLQAGQPVGGGAAPSPAGGGGGGHGGGAVARAAPAVAAQPALPRPQSFEEVVALIGAKRDITLELDVKRFVRLVSFKPGAIDYETGPGAPSDLQRRLALRLKEWTGQTWLIGADGGGGGESLYEREKRETGAARQRLLEDPFVRSVMTAFPGTEVLSMRTLTAETTASPQAGTTTEDDDD